MMSRWLLLAAISSAAIAAEDQGSHVVVTELAKVGAYTVKTFTVEEADGSRGAESSVAIQRGEQPLWAITGYRFNLAEEGDGGDGKSPLLEPGAPLLGHGDPCVVIEEWSGGAHCCYTLHIFRLGDSIEHIDSIPLVHGGWHVEDLDGDGVGEIICHDWVFAYWNACFASSPAPEVVLRKGSGGLGFVPALDLMRKRPIPSTRDLDERAERVRAALLTNPDERDGIAYDLWGTMLDLLYTGHRELAWKHLEACWPAEVPGKSEFASEFRAQLAHSRWWRDIADGIEVPPVPSAAK
jgi:hypothetical protein